MSFRRCDRREREAERDRKKREKREAFAAPVGSGVSAECCVLPARTALGLRSQTPPTVLQSSEA